MILSLSCLVTFNKRKSLTNSEVCTEQPPYSGSGGFEVFVGGLTLHHNVATREMEFYVTGDGY